MSCSCRTVCPGTRDEARILDRDCPVHGDAAQAGRLAWAAYVSRKLHSRPDYREALRRAEGFSWDGPGVDIAEHLAWLRERRGEV